MKLKNKCLLSYLVISSQFILPELLQYNQFFLIYFKKQKKDKKMSENDVLKIGEKTSARQLVMQRSVNLDTAKQLDAATEIYSKEQLPSNVDTTTLENEVLDMHDIQLQKDGNVIQSYVVKSTLEKHSTGQGSDTVQSPNGYNEHLVISVDSKKGNYGNYRPINFNHQMLTDQNKQQKSNMKLAEIKGDGRYSNIIQSPGKQKNGKPLISKKFKVRIQEKSLENGLQNPNIELQLEGEAIKKQKISKDERQLPKPVTSETLINHKNSSVPAPNTDPSSSMNTTIQKKLWPKNSDRDTQAHQQQRNQREQYLKNNASTSIHDQEEIIQDIMKKSNGFQAKKLGESRERRVNFTKVMHDFQQQINHKQSQRNFKDQLKTKVPQFEDQQMRVSKLGELINLNGLSPQKNHDSSTYSMHNSAQQSELEMHQKNIKSFKYDKHSYSKIYHNHLVESMNMNLTDTAYPQQTQQSSNPELTEMETLQTMKALKQHLSGNYDLGLEGLALEATLGTIQSSDIGKYAGVEAAEKFNTYQDALNQSSKGEFHVVSDAVKGPPSIERSKVHEDNNFNFQSLRMHRAIQDSRNTSEATFFKQHKLNQNPSGLNSQALTISTKQNLDIGEFADQDSQYDQRDSPIMNYSSKFIPAVGTLSNVIDYNKTKNFFNVTDQAPLEQKKKHMRSSTINKQFMNTQNHFDRQLTDDDLNPKTRFPPMPSTKHGKIVRSRNHLNSMTNAPPNQSLNLYEGSSQKVSMDKREHGESVFMSGQHNMRTSNLYFGADNQSTRYDRMLSPTEFAKVPNQKAYFTNFSAISDFKQQVKARNQRLDDYKKKQNCRQSQMYNFKKQFASKYAGFDDIQPNTNQISKSLLGISSRYEEEKKLSPRNLKLPNLNNASDRDSVVQSPLAADLMRTQQLSSTIPLNVEISKTDLKTERGRQIDLSQKNTRTVYVGAQSIEFPLRPYKPQESAERCVQEKLDRVTSMADNLKHIKSQVKSHFVNQYNSQSMGMQPAFSYKQNFDIPDKILERSTALNSPLSTHLRSPKKNQSQRSTIRQFSNPVSPNKDKSRDVSPQDEVIMEVADEQRMSQAELDKIQGIIQQLDETYAKRMENRVKGKQSQHELIDYLTKNPDTSFYTKIAKDQIQQLHKSLDHDKREIVKIDMRNERHEFRHKFKNRDIIQDVMQQDKKFREYMKDADEETLDFVNRLLKSVQGTHMFNKALMSKLQGHLSGGIKYMDSINQIQKPRSKKTLRSIIFRGLMEKRYGHDFLKKIHTKKTMDIIYVARIGQLQQILMELLKDQNLGQKYESIGTNIYNNEYCKKAMLSLSQMGPAPDLGLDNLNAAQKTRPVNEYFSEQILKSQFYNHAKEGMVSDEDARLKKILMNYYEFLRDKKQVPLPFFAQQNIENNTLHLSEIKMTDAHSTALKNLLTESYSFKKLWVKNLIIDEVGLSERNFEEILEGLINQGPRIQQLIYQNNQIGPKCIQLLSTLLPDLTVFQMFKAKGITHELLKETTFILQEKARKLMKLRLSGMNLCDKDFKIVDSIGEVIKNGNLLDSIDLSWSQMTPKYLFRLSESLVATQYSLRSINLSYNCLQFGPQHSEEARKFSNDFMDNFIQFTQGQLHLNHIDLSGMGLGKEQIIYLSQELVYLPLLLAVHFNDNNLLNDDEAKEEILDIWGISDLTHKGDLVSKHFQTSNGDKRISLRDIVSKNIKDATREASQSVIKGVNTKLDKNDYQKHLLKIKQSKTVSNMKFQNMSKVTSGASRFNDATLDSFTLTRKLNNPELIYNVDPCKQGYFEVDAQQNWALSEKNECFVCHRYTYCTIFYHQNEDKLKVGNLNQGLIEVKDEESNKIVEKMLDLTLKERTMVSPFILGSVTGGGSYARKNRMLRADLYSLLSISQSAMFLGEKKQSKVIKSGVVKISQKSQIITQPEILDKIQGWNKILYDKMEKNQLTDITAVNLPENLDKEAPDVGEDGISYVYAAFLPAGHHQFLIYCPVTRKLYCKDFLVHPNSIDVCPEFPRLLDKARLNKPKRNVWRKWIDDTQENREMIFMNDITSGKFIPEVFIKDEDQLESVQNQVKQYFQMFQIFQYELMVRSPCYPKIDFESITTMITDIQNNNKDSKKLMEQFPRSFIELSFLKATRTQNVKGLKGQLCRAELFEIILRFVSQIYPRQVKDNLSVFLDTYLAPIVSQSLLLKHRQLIRLSSKLSNLLLINNKHIQKIYEQCSGSGVGFSMEVANRLINGMLTGGGGGGGATPFSQVESQEDLQSMAQTESQVMATPINKQAQEIGPLVSWDVIKQCFLFSKMTIYHEQKDSNKYNSLQFIEFQEFICRIAMRLDPQEKRDPWLPTKELLDLLFADRIARNLVDPAKFVVATPEPDSDDDNM